MAVLEVVRFTTQEGNGTEFEKRLLDGLGVQAEDPACRAIGVYRSIERPDEFLVQLEWDSVEAHHAWRDAHRDRWRARVGWENVVGGPQGLGHYKFVGSAKTPPQS